MEQPTIEETRADIVARNAGEECIVVWKNGNYWHCGLRDAEVATLCEPQDVLLTIRLASLTPVIFAPFAKRDSFFIPEFRRLN